jgi:hypothetical protein
VCKDLSARSRVIPAGIRMLLLSLLAGVRLVGDCQFALAHQPDRSGLVDGLLARSKALVSGRLAYRVTDSNGLEADREFVLSGTSWRVDDRVFHVERINFRGEFAEVHRTAQPDGSVRTSVALGQEVSVEKQKPHPPYFAGSLWYRATADYIGRHKSDATFAGTADVGGISCAILDWVVSAADRFAAFSSIIPPLAEGGVLRLHVSEDLGYVLPRIDYLAPGGSLAMRFESADFWCVGRGIFLPKKATLQTFPGEGQRGYRCEYTIESVDAINDPIPDDAFHAVLPAGTSVSDARAANPLHFESTAGLIALKEMTDADLGILEKMANATELKINSGQITDAALVKCRRMDHLRSIDLSFTQVTDTGFAALAGILTKLERLELAHTQITDATLQRLKAVTGLKTLNLTATRITDAGLVQVGRFTTLQVLLLDQTGISAEGLTNLKSLTELQHLSLSENKGVNDIGVASLRRLKKLRYLTLRGSQVTDAGIGQLKELNDLRTIDLGGTRVTKAGLARLCSTLPKVKVVTTAGEIR